MDEKRLRFLEEQIPEIAQAAVTQAYWAALSSGHKVLQVTGNTLVEVDPNGTKRELKTLAPDTRVRLGQRLRRQ